MRYLVIAFICKLAVETVFLTVKACLGRYKAKKKPDEQTSDK